MANLREYKPEHVAIVRRKLDKPYLDYVRELAIQYDLDYETLVDAFAETCLAYIDEHYQGIFLISKAENVVKASREDEVFARYHQKKQG